MLMLICPKCKSPLNKYDNTYKCSNNHSYDISKHGYVNLLISKTGAGDSKEMVNARKQFLDKGYYQKLALKIGDIIKKDIHDEDYLLDNGCGTGYYDYIIKQNHKNIIGLDISKFAIEKASKFNPDLKYIVASSNDIPLNDKSIFCIINIFSPTFAKENNRVLKDDGLLIVVLPAKKHLLELKDVIYDNPYLNEEEIPNYEYFFLHNKETIMFNENLNYEDIINLLNMTPYIHKTSINDLNKINNIDKLNITFSFNIFMYKKNTN